MEPELEDHPLPLSPPTPAGQTGTLWQVGELLFWAGASTALALNQVKIIVFALTTLYGDPSQAPPGVLQNLTLVSPVFPLLLGLAAWVRLTMLSPKGSQLFGFHGASLSSDLLLGLGSGILALGVAVVSLKLLALRFELPPLSRFPWHYHLYFATVGALIPGVFEEVYFRGLLFRIAPRLPRALMLALSAAVFALWHIGTPVYLLHTFVLGLIFGALTISTGRLAPGIIAHVTANAGFGLLLLAGFHLG